MLGREAAKRKAKAYIRTQHPFYETQAKGTHDEKEDVKPVGTIGIWWHETLRVLASIEEYVSPPLPSELTFDLLNSLNLVILRSGFIYGPYTPFGVGVFVSHDV